MQTIRRTYPLSPLPAALVMALSLGALPRNAATTATRDMDDTTSSGDTTIRTDDAAMSHAGALDDDVARTRHDRMTCCNDPATDIPPSVFATTGAPSHSDSRSAPPNPQSSQENFQ